MRRLLIVSALCGLMLACGGETGSEPPAEEQAQSDLDRIRERGRLRVLLPERIVVNQLPRGGLTLDHERQLIEQFARDEGLEPVWIRISAREELLPRLLAGEGDLVAANLTATTERLELVDFTFPVAVVREQLVGRRDDPDPVRTVAQLAGRKIHIRRSSSFWPTVAALARRQPDLIVEQVDEAVETEEILHRVARGEYDLTVADSNLIDACRGYDLNIDATLDVTGDRPIGFAVRPGSTELRKALNRFLSSVQLRTPSTIVHTDDLAGIKERRVLRVLTRNTAASYFVWRGQLTGFEYELAGEFARRHGLRLEMIVPREDESLYDLLRAGRGDLIAAALTRESRDPFEGVAFCRRYNYVSQVVVGRDGEAAPAVLDDLRGRTFHIRPEKAYRTTLEPLQAQWGFDLKTVTKSMAIEEIFGRVASGEFDLTLADSQTLAIEQSWRDDLQAGVALKEQIPLRWAVREENPELAAAIDAFVRDTYRGVFYNVVYDRYFGDRTTIRTRAAQRRTQGDRLSPYDEIVRRFAPEYGFDWRLIVAQMYQESRFDHRATSFAGAQGLMQMMPRTARELGVDDLSDPETAILAGIRYLDWVRDRFEPELTVQDRMWFALAAYNAGPGHVRDARRLAREQGLDGNRWFGNVERAMLLLSKIEFSSKAQHGYCRCGEPVAYVREIRERYNAYVNTLEDPPIRVGG